MRKNHIVIFVLALTAMGCGSSKSTAPGSTTTGTGTGSPNITVTANGAVAPDGHNAPNGTPAPANFPTDGDWDINLSEINCASGATTYNTGIYTFAGNYGDFTYFKQDPSVQGSPFKVYSFSISYSGTVMTFSNITVLCYTSGSDGISAIPQTCPYGTYIPSSGTTIQFNYTLSGTAPNQTMTLNSVGSTDTLSCTPGYPTSSQIIMN